MKVNIGKYPRKANTKRKISVKIEPFDTWSMDHTLALIIHPMLVQLKKTKNGYPYTDKNDTPHIIADDNDDGFDLKRWVWILDEMIWAFEQILDPDAEDQFHSGEHDQIVKEVDVNGVKTFEIQKGPKDTYSFDVDSWKVWHDRKSNGLRLFGRYFQDLWD